MTGTDPYDTFLSTSTEWHAFGHGVYHGIRSWSEPIPSIPTHPDVATEPHYYKAGYVVGKAVPIVFLWALSKLGADHDPFGGTRHCPRCQCR